MHWHEFPTFKTAAFCAVLFAVAGLAVPAHAACPAHFSPHGLTVLPDDNGQVLLHYSASERLETLVIQPEFTGTATEFGLVMPVPGKPEINEAPPDLFEFLALMTEMPRSEHATLLTDSEMSATEDSTVTVIMKKDVGDFKTTVLVADRADDLTEWLNYNGFEFEDADTENFDYYIKKGGYYFVALRVNMDKADVDAGGQISGRLNPIEFVFESEHPMLPLRIMSGDAGTMRFTVYTLGDVPYYIRGADIRFVDILSRGDIDTVIRDSDMPKPQSDHMFKWLKGLLGITDWEHDEHLDIYEQLDRYEPVGKWLVRMDVRFNPGMIDSNLLLDRANPNAPVLLYTDLLVMCNQHNPLIPPGASLLDPVDLGPGVLNLDAKCAWYAPDLGSGLGKYAYSVGYASISPVLPAGTHSTIPAQLAIDASINEVVKDRIRAAEGSELVTPGVVTDPASIVLFWPDFGDTVKPLKQLGYGIPPHSIECADWMQLVMSHDQRPACVAHSSVPALAERGWDASDFRTSELERLS
ncbi:MAG: DUF2330 domain-containing protein [Thaumarchaeota archaeon]|nr:DUF2330 domain-containing protein [Nitrososphaerota archaeon]